MSKFKVGDIVVRTGKDYKDIKKGGIYVVSEVPRNANKWSCAINLEGHYNKNGEFDYEGNSFELYEESSMNDKGILTPLQAAEAILKNDDLQVYDSCCEQWYSLPYCHKTITIEYLKNTKIRLKPKTITINGVEVPAPAKKEDIEQYFYTVNFSENIVHTVDKLYINNNFKYYWTTEGDAQKALDAMLIPFNDLEKG